LVQGYLCAECRKKLTAEGKEVPAEELLSRIRDCCSHTPGFITERLPILESIFRLLLALGNQPLSLEELGRQLSEWRSGDTYRTSPEILSRLLKNEQYYGLREAPD
jgi:hypothetical protein